MVDKGIPGWPEVDPHAAKDQIAAVGLLARFAALRAANVPARDIDAVAAELATRQVPSTGLGLEAEIDAAHRRVLWKAAHDG